MKTDIQEFKCPNCGGDLKFDAATQKMLCAFCDSSFLPSVVGAPEPAADIDVAQWRMTEQTWKPDEAQTMKTYLCKSCGGEILTETTTSATSCPYCGNPVVLSDRVTGMLRPDYVIPFQITEDEVKKTLRSVIRRKRFAPFSFAGQNRLKEIKGVYVPFWLFDSDVSATVQFDAQQTTHWTDGQYDCTEISAYRVARSGDMRFENIPVDASKKMPDSLMDSLEPFRFAEAVSFRPSYLSGYYADAYDVTAEESAKRADERIKSSAKQELRSTVSGYSSVSVRQSEVHILPDGCKYALFPVWLLQTQYLGKTFRFTVNGQTGKLVGSIPISRAKLAGLFCAVMLGVSGLLWGLGYWIGLY